MGELRFRLLGEVGAVGGRPVVIRHARVRCVLAALLVDVNKVVSGDALADRVWGERLPRRPREAIYSYLSRLRGALAEVPEARLVKRAGGYVLEADAVTVDLHRFRALTAAAAGAGDERRAALLGDALALWAGEPLTGADSAWATEVREALVAEHVEASLDCFTAGVRLGRHAEAVAPLTALAAARPLDERVACLLLRALADGGRQAEALAHYDTLRRHLADDLGVDPGPEVQEVFRRVLTAHDGGAPVVPRQLPPAPRHFLGRARELAALDAALAGGERTVVISAIRGAGGIGKTWLAVHWAHRHAARYPDGQLYANLRGFDPTAAPVAPTTVLRGFLVALGVAPDAVPDDPDEQVALYRSTIADRRVLVVLDNAVGTAQVEPLLPGGRACTTVITSRNPMTGLVAVHGALPVPVDVLSDDEAHALLTRRLGAARTGRAADAVVRHCAGLPLALGIVAARAATRPDLGLAAIAAELALLTTRLDALDTGEANLSLRAVLSWSHQALPPAAARLFALLGHAPALDLAPEAIASLAGGDVGDLLDVLEAAHLVTRSAPGRYRLHDLVRLYAAEQAPPDEDALRRLVDGFLHTALAADRLLDPARPPFTAGPPAPGVVRTRLADRAHAIAWLTAEHQALLAAQATAADRGWHDKVWELALALDSFHWQQGRSADHVAVLRAGLTSAETAGEVAVQVRLLCNLGHAGTRAGLNAESVRCFRRCVELTDDDPTSRGHARLGLARAHGQQGDLRRAQREAAAALRDYREARCPQYEASALNQLGWITALRGEYDEALAHCRAALDTGGYGTSSTRAETLDSIGYIHERTGELPAAAAAYREAVEEFERHGYAFEMATTLERLGGIHVSSGDNGQAHLTWSRALAVYREQNLAEAADRVRRKLADLPG
ncbi:AfsR/SARP family transcriptional regulator [Saccharothrix syringae]|uniref:AfsR/SARP family transcriptional regulator n=1 Tax=Saccharothrix syringae TaxID=103733 RepID=A0A5Q0H085_SACSY|nr:BTAD domain-containing putative transcriptional regulator [Saccharothrix syringae]QFZ19637.1 AfsR/SARP family transcriptional regulator [Saccharothrix syringae]